MINVIFMGRKPVAALALEWLNNQEKVAITAVITDSHLSVSPTRDMAESLFIPVLSRDEAEAKLSNGQLQVDFGVSVLYWQKIREPLLAASRLGVINFHPAPLPEYKGTAGYNLAILESLEKWAVTAHYVDEEIDTGGIIDICWFDVDVENETAMSLEKKTQPLILHQFKKVVSSAIKIKGPLPTSRNIGGKYISREEMEAMKEVKEGDDVARKIRAFWFPPYDGAYQIINGVKCTLVHRPILNTLANPNTSNLFTSSSES